MDDDDLKPEETLADSLSDLSVIEIPIARSVFRLVYLLVIAAGCLVVFKSFQLQIVKGGLYSAAIQKNSVPRYSAPSLRGIIYDAGLKPLVENVPVFDLAVLSSDLPEDRQKLDDIADRLGGIVSIPKEDLLKTFEENKTSFLYFIKEGLSKEEIAKINLLKPEGIFILANSERHHPYGSVFSELLGYTSKVSENDMTGDDYYLSTDKIGKLGLEQYYEEQLRGEHRDLFLKNSDLQNGSKNEADDLQSQPGKDLFLSVDAEMQSKLYQIMAEALNSSGLSRGAGIVQDPNTGAVLAMVSMPSFDSNIFENYHEKENSEKIAKILEDQNKPLFNRVVSGRYSSGSTIKPLLAMAGLKEGVVTTSTTINAQGSISVRSKYDPNVIYTFRDWKVHGVTDIFKAIAYSVDVYFYALGGGYGNIRGLGEEKIISYYRQMLIDKTLGIDFPGEISGFVPDEAWKLRTKGEEWFVGDTYNISIGQGDLGVTPLWLNTYISSFANGGKFMKPFIVKEIRNADGSLVEKKKPEVIMEVPFDQKTMQIVREGLRLVISGGSARALNDLPLPIAGKTGTAQITGTGYNSIFISYGPYDNPKIAMTILIENVLHEGLSTKIAHDFYQWYFSRSSGS